MKGIGVAVRGFLFGNAFWLNYSFWLWTSRVRLSGRPEARNFRLSASRRYADFEVCWYGKVLVLILLYTKISVLISSGHFPRRPLGVASNRGEYGWFFPW